MSVNWLTGLADCCCGGCPSVYADDFARADNSDLGAEWTEVSGTWEIDTLALECTAAGTAINSYSDTDNSYIVICTVSLPTNGDKVRVVVGRQDASNYLYAQVHRTAATTVALKTYKVQAGVHTLIAENAAITAPNQKFIIKACWNGDQLRFGAEIRQIDDIEEVPEFFNSFSGGTVYAYAEYVNITGTYGSGHGLEVNTVGTAVRFGYYKLFDPNSANVFCPTCVGECSVCGNGGLVAEYYAVTLTGFGGGHDGTYIMPFGWGFGFPTDSGGPCVAVSATTPGGGTLAMSFSGIGGSSCIHVTLNTGGFTYCWRTNGILEASFLCIEFDEQPLIKKTGTEIGFFPCCNNGAGYAIPPAGDVYVTALGD